jgi:hypothetical protein
MDHYSFADGVPFLEKEDILICKAVSEYRVNVYQ